jgi:hypothetical protein
VLALRGVVFNFVADFSSKIMCTISIQAERIILLAIICASFSLTMWEASAYNDSRAVPLTQYND